jgi:hypothetical protein
MSPTQAQTTPAPVPAAVYSESIEQQFVFRQYAFREECARALFECCRLNADLLGLVRARSQLGTARSVRTLTVSHDRDG